MEITTGRLKGMTGKLHQFANGWMTVDIEGERPNTVVSPNQVKLNAEEIAKVRAANPDHLGIFWDLWQMYDDGTFVARESKGQAFAMGATGNYGRPRRYR